MDERRDLAPPSTSFLMSSTPTSPRALLVILDGWGIDTRPEVDAIAQARTPTYDRLVREAANAELVTFGEEVGLPEGQMGNSEVGHLNIGAGRVVYQELARINKAIREGTLADEQALLDLFAFAKTPRDNGKPRTLHLLGLVSDGGVHSHIDHLLALCDAAEAAGVKELAIHAFTDGRDTDPNGGAAYLDRVLQHIGGTSARLATITGRYYAMDRDKRWERIRVAYNALVHGQGAPTDEPLAELRQRYDSGQTDEFVEPIICLGSDGTPVAKIESGDAVLFFNFRTDRPRQLTDALTQNPHQEQGIQPIPDLHFTTMTRYDEAFDGLHVVYSKKDLSETLGEVLAKAEKTQLRIAETEKYPHVTFFFNGGREEPFTGESRIIVPSPKVATYDLQPEMSAPELKNKLIKFMREKQPDFVCVNFANTDMVGHTGVWDAALIAAETVDSCLAELLEVASELEYNSLIIADHGNSDIMRNPDGSAHTAHTTNPVPVIFVPAPSNESDARLRSGKLGDIAPTILQLLNLEQPAEMNGTSLLTS